MVRRGIDLTVIHCSVTCADRCFTEYDLKAAHCRRGFNGYDYHFYIHENGNIKTIRPIGRTGTHARGRGACPIGICYKGGLDEEGRPTDTHTRWQHHPLRMLARTLLLDYPGCRICGHRDLSPDLNGNGEIEPGEWVK